MRRALLYLFGFLVAAGAAVFALRHVSSHGGSGYVIVGIGQWSVESSLLFTGVLLVVTFVLLYFAVRLIVTAISLPKILKQRGFEQRNKSSQEALLAGLIESAEGNFETAEKHLIRHAANSGVPLINYLTAARAAQSRGALEQRDEYLKLAQETMPEAELAIGLTKAELQLSNLQFEEALESLTQLDKIAPSHAAVLKLMHQAYANLADWQGLSLIIPQLKSNKVMMEAEIKLLETETFCSLIKQKTEARDAVALRNLWLEIPGHIRKSSGVLQLYCAAMIEAGAEVEVEPLVRQAIGTEWSETLIVLYGCIHMPDTVDQLVKGEAWLKAHPKDAILLRVLGKLSLRAGLLDKAASYLKASLAAEPSVEAYQLMGDVLMKENDPLSACQFFRNGLLFASNEVVALIEQNPEVDAAEGEG